MNARARPGILPPHPSVSRRTFARQSLGSLLTLSLVETLCRLDLFAGAVKPITARWLAELDQLGRDLKSQKLAQTDWQTMVDQLLARVDLDDLLRFIDFGALTSGVKLVDNGARVIRFRFPPAEGLPDHLVFDKQIFALRKGRSVVPHGHNNMASAFLILKGELHGRHYQRLEDATDHYIIRPTIDRAFAPGDCSTISDHRDNVHWFQALTEPAYLFNIHMMFVRPGVLFPTGRVYLDPNGEKLAGGLIRAPRLSYSEAHRLYG